MKELYWELEMANIKLEGDFVKGYPAYYSRVEERYLPGEPDALDDFKIYLVKLEDNGKEKLLDITDYVSKSEHKKLFDKLFEECLEGYR